MPIPKNDCFAYENVQTASGRWVERCTALNEIECAKRDTPCPFYKNYGQNVAELRKYNNCSRIEEAIAEYARKHVRSSHEEDD